MTTPLYLDNSETARFEATVKRVLDRQDSTHIVLDRTHFYPQGGGQPSDTGRLVMDDREWTVGEVEKKDTIYHSLDSHTGPEEGTTVMGILDWDRRFSLMRYHSAQHVLSAILVDEYDGPTAGNQLYPDRARIDCLHATFSPAQLDDIEARINEIVDDDRSIEWYELDRSAASYRLDPNRTRLDLLPDSVTRVRIVEIDGVDLTACAGTHVRNTGLIGEFSITKRETGGQGRERIRFSLS